jgi:glycosyltransferase involved in cell wall biosynthesis
VARTPDDFRRYVQGSRGEFGCAKPSYVRTRPGWVSDRTVCYLASGRPCVAEDTGAARHLPASAGLRFFATTEEAADAIAAIEADYTASARAARALAEEVFSTSVVLPGLLRAAGAR